MLQRVERKIITLDALVQRWVDPVLHRLNGTTLEALFGPPIRKVTVRQLLSMRSGINDYDDGWLKKWTNLHPELDFTVLDFLHQVNKTWMFQPGQHCAYSSLNYGILGLLLVALDNVTHWQEFDQMSVIPPHLQSSFNATMFPTSGPCSQYSSKGMVNQYGENLYYYTLPNGTQGVENAENIVFHSMLNESCLNGWTFGNIAAAPRDIAHFYYLLGFSDVFVSPNTRTEMTSFGAFDMGWTPGQPYGLGLMTFDYKTGSPPKTNPRARLIGHGGADYGSQAIISGWNEELKFGLVLAINGDSGMNCSFANFIDNYLWLNEDVCKLYSTVLSVTSQGQLPTLQCGAARDELKGLPSTYRCSNFSK